jgi:hypothetical protein
MANASRPRHFQTPRASGGKLIAPPIDSAGRLIAEHRERLAGSTYDVHGTPLVALAAEARRDLLEAAEAYTRQYRDIPHANLGIGTPRASEIPSLILAGHQPELFHPGVWLKHFALDGVARSNHAVAVNLLIDSDTIKTSSLRVPTGTPSQPMVEAVLFDRPTTAVPFEERAIVDRAMFESFGTRAAKSIASLVPGPFVESFWPEVVRRSRQTSRLGECLAQARHAWEGRWGTTTLEIPQSRVAGLPAFHRFVAHLLSHLPRLWEIYNAALYEFRRANRIRSHAHPVPALAEDGDWLEAPLWVWRSDDPARRRLFVRSRNDQIVLADRAGWERAIDLSADGELDRAIEQLHELARHGVRLRTRALVTTMLARVLLGDLFIHGIGGAKYDQMTDVLVERFFGLTAPGYMVVSGTLRLPIEHQADAAEALRAARAELRRMTYQPERFVDLPAEKPPCEKCGRENRGAIADEPWHSIQQKRQWVETPQTAANSRTRHNGIVASNSALQPWVDGKRRELNEAIARLEQAVRADTILSSREYAFCLYPEAQLREFLTGEM